jgi:general secretion pathway protein G
MNEDIRVGRLLRRVARRVARGTARGVTLVEVLIVVAIMAVISGGVAMFALPALKESRIKAAIMGCQQVREAAGLYQSLDAASDACPTMQDLVAGKRVKGTQTDDPWGMPYRIDCATGEIRVFSNGNDRKPQTPDDVDDGMKQVDVLRLKNL